MRKKRVWSPHPYLVAAARKVWRWSPERRACLSSGQRGEKTKKSDTRERLCEKCQKWFPFKEVAADHISPVGKQPREFAEYPAFYERLFCARTNLQRLCKPCHKTKSAQEAKTRKKAA